MSIKRGEIYYIQSYMSIEDYNGRRIAGAYEVYAKR